MEWFFCVLNENGREDVFLNGLFQCSHSNYNIFHYFFHSNVSYSNYNTFHNFHSNTHIQIGEPNGANIGSVCFDHSNGCIWMEIVEWVIIGMEDIWIEKIVEWVIIRMGVLEWTIQKHLSPSILIQDTKIHSNSWCDWWTIWMEKLNCWNKHSFQKTIWMKNLELLKQTPIQIDFLF